MCKLVHLGGHCPDNRNLANATEKVEKVLSDAVTVIKDVVTDRETWLERCRQAIRKVMQAQARLAKRRTEAREARKVQADRRHAEIRDELRREAFRGAVERHELSVARRDELIDELHEVELKISMFEPGENRPEPKEIALMHLELAKAEADGLAWDAHALRTKLTKADWEKTPWTPRREKYEEIRRREADWRGFEAGCRQTYENMPAREELAQLRDALVGDLTEAEQQVKEDKLHRDRLSRTGRPTKDMDQAATSKAAA